MIGQIIFLVENPFNLWGYQRFEDRSDCFKGASGTKAKQSSWLKEVD